MSEQKKEKLHLNPTQKALAVIAIVLAVVLAVVVIYKSVFVKPDVGGSGISTEEDMDWGDGVRPKGDGKRKSKDFYTVLVLGRDTGGGGNTDTMLLASYDVTNQKAAVMSIPRDTMVNVPWDVKKINSVYNFNGGGDEGLKALYKEISQLVGFAPDYQVVVEWEAVGAIVDAIGGVWFDNPYPMDYHDPNQDLVIEQAPGNRLLTGEDAMQVIRWRANDNNSPYGYQKKKGGIGDTGRMKLQQDFLKAVMVQLLRPENVKNIGKIIKVFQNNVETDLSFQNILWFGQQAIKGGLNPDTINFMTMPYDGVMVYSRTYTKQLGRYTELSYVTPRVEELLDAVNNHLSPYAEPFTRSDLDIMYKNEDGTIGSTTGVVEDTRATRAPSRPQTPPDQSHTVDPEEIPLDPEHMEEPDEPEVPDVPEVPENPQDPQDPQVPQPEPEVPQDGEVTPPAPVEPEPQPEPVPQPEPEAPADPNPPVDDGFSVTEPAAPAA